MEHDKYFANLDEIEERWGELKKGGFPQNLRDQFWRLCGVGRELFWLMRNDHIKDGYTIVSKVPAYERAIMLLEHERRYKDAIRLCEEANNLDINTDWYTKRIKKLIKIN